MPKKGRTVTEPAAIGGPQHDQIEAAQEDTLFRKIQVDSSGPPIVSEVIWIFVDREIEEIRIQVYGESLEGIPLKLAANRKNCTKLNHLLCRARSDQGYPYFT